jgi:hypothetical protein
VTPPSNLPVNPPTSKYAAGGKPAQELITLPVEKELMTLQLPFKTPTKPPNDVAPDTPAVEKESEIVVPLSSTPTKPPMELLPR